MNHDDSIKTFDDIEAIAEESTGSLLTPSDSPVAYAVYETALQEIAQLKSFQNESNNKISELEAEITRLKEQLLLMQQRHFGKKSEIQVGEPVAPPNAGNILVTAHMRSKGKPRGKTLDTSNLPRYKIYHDLTEDEKICSCCRNLLEKIKEETSQKLEIVPARLYVAEHIRFKYCCRTCQTIKMAHKPKAAVPKALAGDSLLTEVAIGKYAYHLPLYRQSKMLEGYHVVIPNNTLGNWVVQSGTSLMPIYAALWEELLKVNYLQVDETPVQVLKAGKKGYLWVYLAPHLGLVGFELSITRSGTVAETRLSNFKGLLQTDGYGGYHNLRKRKDVTGIGCLTHARRYFSEIFKITKNTAGIAAQFIERVQPLYALEARMREQKLTFHTRKRLRQKQAGPILKELKSWLKIQKVTTPPKSQLGKAIQYTLNQWCYIFSYIKHGAAEIDTNFVENIIRPTALGKKNWLFINDEDNGIIHALWYSLILSAKLHGLNYRVYIHYLLTQSHNIRQGIVDPSTLLPHTIEHDKLKSFAEKQLILSKQVLGSS